MAHMIPSTPPDPHRPGGRGERILYDAFQSGLDDQWFVYHGLHYLDDQTAAEGEADFLVVHRELGMLVVECKGHGVRVDGEGRWFRETSHGEKHMKESPFDQASRTKFQLIDELLPRYRRLLCKSDPHAHFPLLMGHAVALPLCNAEPGELPLEGAPEIVMYASDLSEIAKWTEDALRFWHRKENLHFEPMPAKHFKNFRRKVLAPKYQAIENLGATLEANRSIFVRLTNEQCRVIDGLLENPRITVSGGAGTGKTVLAAHAAREYAEGGHSTLFLCYTRALSKSLDMAINQHHDVKVEVRHFHSLCFQACKELGEDPNAPGREDPKGAVHFWNVVMPAKLKEAVEAKKMPKFDVIVVDEGQDFLPEWWEGIEGLLGGGEHTHLVVFQDPSQDIFQRDATPQNRGFDYHLRDNFRNTHQIARFAAKLLNINVPPHPECPDGPEPELLQQKPNPEGPKQVAEIVRDLTKEQGVHPKDITILTPHSRPNSFLAGHTHIANLELASDPMDRAGKILHTSIGAFKGLESPVIIVADLKSNDDRSNPHAQYVAASRATQVLYWLELE